MKTVIAIIFLILSNIPFQVMAETWSCKYKSTEGPAEDTTDFVRKGKVFKASNLDGDYLIAKENQFKIVLVDKGISDYVIELKKDNVVDGSINFIDLSDMAQWTGKCLVVGKHK